MRNRVRKLEKCRRTMVDAVCLAYCRVYLYLHDQSLALEAASPEATAKEIVSEVAHQEALLRGVEATMAMDRPINEVSNNSTNVNATCSRRVAMCRLTSLMSVLVLVCAARCCSRCVRKQRLDLVLSICAK